MGLYFLGTRDFASVEMSHLTAEDLVFVFGHGDGSRNDDNRAKLRYVDGPGVSSRPAYDGGPIFWCTTHPTLTWPGSQDGAHQVFYHDDWPGVYHAVNVNPRFWAQPLISAADVIHRGEYLPNCPVGLPETPMSQTEASCRLCCVPLDLRYSWGHGWHDGTRLVRAGTDEIIAKQVGPCMLDAPGPYCAQCIEAALYGDGLLIPDGYRYIERHNRSLPADCEIPEHPSKWAWSDHQYSEACRRYGHSAFEWTLGEDPQSRSMRIRSAAKLLRDMDNQF